MSNAMQNYDDYYYVMLKLQSGIFNFNVIAPLIGISRRTLSKIAYGETESPQPATVIAIAEFFRKVGE